MKSKYRQIQVAALKGKLDLPAAVIAETPKELGARCQLRFRESNDDLDSTFEAFVQTADGHQFGLVCHKHAPKPGIELILPVTEKNAATRLGEVLNLLSIRKQDLGWINPVIKRQLTGKKPADYSKSGVGRGLAGASRVRETSVRRRAKISQD
ncbi:MAG: hypothetical protein K1X53_09680 [Candidatus Sumerlaeaceae bacterium]|nr:hypothetical protein [Candidatus Sumerlaeaceae bacterium]